MALSAFHPAVAAWFTRALGKPTAPQADGWPRIKAGECTLIAAPTGSGKTLAAFLSAIDDLVKDAVAGALGDETRVLYVSPLKALGNDIERNLEMPLAGIDDELEAMGLPRAALRTMVRTGDTASRDRARMTARPPHIVVTTPESFYILLTSERGRALLSTVRAVLVDEIHALVGDKRGSHLALSLARLDALVGTPVQRIGLSATQKPIERVARFLVGAGPDGAPRHCAIVDSGHLRSRDLAIEVPASPLEAVMSGEVWNETYDRLAEHVRTHRTTLIFVNTRRLAERVTRHLGDRVGAENVTSHHGSLAREQRFQSEQRLKSGALKALVATASLELGIDIGSIDLVCQVGSTRSIARLLQRVGRAGHQLDGVSKGRLFPLTRDELVECIALLAAVRDGELDQVCIPEAPLDILAQQIVAAAASDEWDESALFDLFRSTYPYAGLSRASFDAVVQMLADGFSTRRGRRGARIHRDLVNGKLRGRRGSRLTAITSGGAIPDMADYEVVVDPTNVKVGSINEDFAIESMQGDIFQLGNASWKILRVEPGTVRVEDARGQPPTIPFWLGEAPGRTRELSSAVSRFRASVDSLLADGSNEALDRTIDHVAAEPGIPKEAARQAVEYLAAGRAALGVIPTEDTLVLERFFDDSGGMQLVVHAPLGSRINRAWGLALRKRFCQRFDFELQAAATDDAIVLSLGPTHSFPLEEVFDYLRVETAREVLVKAALLAPMFGTRWRWNATRALAVLRWRGGKRVPPRFQRMDADDLTAVVFPDQVACQENVAPGDREIPDHPLVEQTIRDCLVEAMDVDGFEELLRDIAAGKKRLVARDTVEPSPFTQEILTARPYAFLDDAPLEERRTQAVYSRRYLDPRTARDLGALDAAAIDRVRSEAWPVPVNADELHEALVLLGFATEAEGRRYNWTPSFEALRAARRVAEVHLPSGPVLWVAAERWAEVGLALSADLPDGARLVAVPEFPPLRIPSVVPVDADVAFVELLRGRLESLGPTTANALAAEAGVAVYRVESALAALESEGFVLRGVFTAGATETEWCERRLLARVHRYTLGRLRSEIEPVSQADYMRFLASWQRTLPETKMRGPEAVAAVLTQLEGYEAPAAAWEAELLPSRIVDYEPGWLDALCLSGRFVWLRRSPAGRAARASGPVRATPIALVGRANVAAFRAVSPPEPLALGGVAERVRGHLEARGASFFDDVVRGTGCHRAEIEDGLAELVSNGLVTSDSFAGLRALLVPAAVRARLLRRRRGGQFPGMESAGRWSLLSLSQDGDASAAPEEVVEVVARALLRRYGVVSRRVLEREPALPPWRELLRTYRRLEARGDLRGGRFVAGWAGEQYALPEAVDALRSVRRSATSGVLVSLSAGDPLNLVGIVTPGERIPAIASNRVLFRDGVPVARKVGATVEILASADSAELGERAALETALVRRPVPERLRAYGSALPSTAT
ncbi:MAG TPA: DEAD/DEAH box helicase [Polyangiaceae bacterium]|nr:DEAD/DEAH box helicase [Polyangiaceae bacterium]